MAAEKSEAFNRPRANKMVAFSPASGPNARAASLAPSILRAGFEEGCRAGDHDERGHKNGEKRSDEHIHFLVMIILDLDAFIDNGRLLVELHPGRDGRADDGHENGHITGIKFERLA